MKLNKVPAMLRALSSKVGNISQELLDIQRKNHSLLKIMNEHTRIMTDNVRVRQVNIWRWLPFRSDTGVRRFFRVRNVLDMLRYAFRHALDMFRYAFRHYILLFQNDENFPMRMAGIRRHLIEQCDFSTVKRHAGSFCKELFSAEYRSWHVIKKSDLGNKKNR